MDIAAIINWVKANIVTIVAIYGAVVTLASLIVKATPTPKDDAILAKIIAFVSKWIALNPSEKKMKEMIK